jgi:hypothetical protein
MRKKFNQKRAVEYRAKAMQRQQFCHWCGLRRPRRTPRGRVDFLCQRDCRIGHRTFLGDIAESKGWVVIASPVGKSCERCGDSIPVGNGRNYARARWCRESCRTAAKNAKKAQRRLA